MGFQYFLWGKKKKTLLQSYFLYSFILKAVLEHSFALSDT